MPFVVFSPVHDVHVHVALNLTLEVEAGRLQLGRGLAPLRLCRHHHFLLLQTVFWVPTAGPHAVASWQDVVHIRNKNNY